MQSRGATPDIVVILFDDVGFSDFGCYGSEIETPNIDRLAGTGLRYTGFHTTAMCSPTRASLLTGRNHHAVGMGCLANFDSGFPGYRGKIARSAGTIAEMLRPRGWNNYMVGKWHVTPLTETGHGGPYDGWPLQRGFDRFYGFLDAETDQYTPALVADNTPVMPPGTPGEGYFLTEDLVDQAILNLRNQWSVAPHRPSFTLLSFGACHAPHQAPRDLIEKYDAAFACGWDEVRVRRLRRQIEMGVVPAGTALPERNEAVQAWAEHSDDEKRVFTRLQAAYAAMLDHADREIGRLVAAIEAMGRLDNTLLMVLSDNGASQEGGPRGFVNAMGPFNGQPEEMELKLARIDDIGGADTHSNFPWGWSMAANTPLKRYKQNTHGGGIRDPLVVHWPAGLDSSAGLRHQFCHVSDLVPTLLDLVGVQAPEVIDGVNQQAMDGVSFASTLFDPTAASAKSSQYFEMFGHRGLWADGWKAVAYHAPGTDFADDQWELYHLDNDFSEVHDLAADHPDRLQDLISRWWEDAARYKVLPLDDRFGPRFAENAKRTQPTGRAFTFWNGMGHLPTDAAPDVRSRSYRITAHVAPFDPEHQGVLIAHGDNTCGYCLYVTDGYLVHDINIGGRHHVLTSDEQLAAGATTLAVEIDRTSDGPGLFTLLVDGEPGGSQRHQASFFTTISWEGLDIGCDRLSPVGHYDAPFIFTGELRKVVVATPGDRSPYNLGMHFVLVRHGEPAWTEDGINRDDPRLTARGRQQAILLAGALVDKVFDAVWVSPKRRAIETASPYLELTGASATNQNFLEEIGNPDWEGTDHDALEIFAAHRRRHPDQQWQGLEGGESVTDFHDRVTSGLDAALLKMGARRSREQLPTWHIDQEKLTQRVLVFAHAGTNSVLLTHLLGVSPVPWEWERFVTGHASITVVEPIEIGEHHGFSMVKLSESRHLPDHLLTR